MTTDKIYSNQLESISKFEFNYDVAHVFNDMIHRSVPGYDLILSTIGQTARQFAQDNSNYYDLGCSLGGATLAMRRSIPYKNSLIIAVDNSDAMLEKCQAQINAYPNPVEVKLVNASVEDVVIENAAMVVLNFTLQFINPDSRKSLIKKIYDGLKPGGILILSEKIISTSKVMGSLMIDWHESFKKSNGYSELEVSQKRTALEGVLKPDTMLQLENYLKSAGFEEIDTWFKQYNFCSIIAIKS